MKTAYELMMAEKHDEFGKLIDANPGFVDAYDDEGFTLLHQAATHDCHEPLQYLIKKGAAVDAKGPSGEHPLHLAAYNGSEPCIRTLVKAGAAIEGLDSDGCSPLYFAGLSDSLLAAECLVELGAEVTMEHMEAAGEAGSMHVFAFFERSFE
jgi:ankyrin repeat protein